MKKILTALFASILTITTAFALVGCSNENAPKTGWTIERFMSVSTDTESDGSSSTVSYPAKIGFSAGSGSEKVSEVWVNIGKLKSDTTFTVAVFQTNDNDKLAKLNSSYASFQRVVTSGDVKDAKDNDGWIALGFDSKWADVSATKNIYISIDGFCTVNEIVLVDTDGDRMSLSVERVNYWYRADKKSNPVEIAEKDSIKDEKSNPLLLVDEQTLFDSRTK